ncbi:MAG: ATP-binding protein [Motiliproteus sp.]|nr:ATP-binding protein [Motiliproteus sp.]MCW9053878.1 ATP-binding protein [Motiliproteus sp.]
MNLIRSLNHYRAQNPLGVRLLTAILVCSSAITLLATATQLYLDYKNELSAIDERIQQIEASSLDSLASSLWEINPEQIQIQLDGLKQLPDVEFLQLVTPFEEQFSSGTKPTSPRIVHREYPLTHKEEDRNYDLGTFKLTISLEQVYKRLADRVLVILTTQGIKTFLVSVFILYIFHRLITQHLGTMAQYARKLKLDRLETPLKIHRPRAKKEDEISQVVNAMNEMRESMLEDMSRRAEAERALEKLNTELEQRVQNRTEELQKANRELQTTLDELRTTQEKLIESEKMAALGGLVAGVAHEINTPIGIGFTAATFLKKQSETQLQQLSANDQQRQFTELALESSDLIGQNLERAAQLVSAFKRVSVDQSSEQRRRFNLREYLDEIVLSLKPRLKKTNHQIDIQCAEEISLDSYPGAIYQILTNLILNSLIHGFEHKNDGRISIQTEQLQRNKGAFLKITYRDNGVGIPIGFERRLFEPFVTTKRNQGCSGLGMHIAFNLVTQLLEGEIRCVQDTHEGACFVVELPIDQIV